MNWNFEEAAFFPMIVFRTPAFPLSEFAAEDNFYYRALNTPAFIRALYLASPGVYKEAVEWMEGKGMDAKKEKKLKKTLYNYWLRMHSNCTPFGFFASLSLAQWGEKTSARVENGAPAMRLDMDLIAQLVNYLETIPSIYNNLRFYPNNTCYRIDDKIRYNEIYFEEKNAVQVICVEENSLLSDLLKFAIPGKTREEIAAHVCSQEDFSREEVLDFIDDLVRAQLLLSELTLNLTGESPLDRTIRIVQEIEKKEPSEAASNTTAYLLGIKEFIHQICIQEERNFIPHFENLHKHLTDFLPDADIRKMLQVDTFGPLEATNTIDVKLQRTLYEAIKIMSSFQQNDYIPHLENFKKKFVERYENAVMPLMQVLDTESGISFGEFKYIDENLFSSELMIVPEEGAGSLINDTLTKSKILLYKKYMDCLLNNKEVLYLEKADFEAIEDNFDKLASTCQIIFEYVGGEDDLVSLITIGNSCAGNLISRFAYASEALDQTLKEIGHYEQACFSNSITAEIIHIPEYRIGNLTFRPSFRPYEIPIVTQSTLPAEQQILLEDIYITVQNNRIVLISKKHGKYIMPKLTNAHNYGNNTLPIYQFLSELSYQNMVPSLMLDRGLLGDLNKYIPRIQYENVILAKASWLLTPADIQRLVDRKETLGAEDVEAFRAKWKMPVYTEYLEKSGKALLIKWDDLSSVHNFLTNLEEKIESLYFTEFSFNPETAPFRDGEGKAYNNQVIAFFMNKAMNPEPDKYVPFVIDHKSLKRNYFPCDEWVYLKIYCGFKTYNQILPEIIAPTVRELYEKEMINKCFFLPYNDPGFHLRLRLRANPGAASDVVGAVTNALNHSAYTEAINKIQLDTYNRELERYGGHTITIAEEIFSTDSSFIFDIYLLYLRKYEFYMPLLVMAQIDAILSAFSMDTKAKYEFIETIKSSYASEFSVTSKSELKVQVDKKLNDFRKDIELSLDGQFPFMEAEDNGHYLNKIEAYKNSLSEIYLKNLQVFNDAGFSGSFLRSILHMHAIRCFADRPRQNELFIYHSLYNYYKKQYYLTGKPAAAAVEKVN